MSHNWVFFGEFNGKERQLFNIGKLPIKRHIAIKGDANPYDTEWEQYFEKRISRHMAQSLEGRRKLLAVWREQDGYCPICQQKVTTETGWHVHHIEPRALGGTDNIENLIFVHPTCHRQIHARHLSVEKPRPA